MNAYIAVMFAMIILIGTFALVFLIAGLSIFHERGMTHAEKNKAWGIFDSIVFAGLGIVTLGIAKHWNNEKLGARYLLIGSFF